MEATIGRKLDMLARVDDLLSSAPEFAPLTGSTARASLSATIAEMNAYVTAQNQGDRESRGATQTQRTAMLALRRRMRTVAAAARFKLREAPDFVKLTMPKGRPPVQALLAAADGMAGAAAAHHDVLVASGLPADFLDGLGAAITGLRTAIAGRHERIGMRIGATKSIKTISSNVSHVVTMLDGLVVPLIPPHDPGGLLARWKAAKRIGRKRSPVPAAAPDASHAEVTSKAA